MGLITLLRNKLHKAIEQYGIEHTYTLEVSRELDKAIFKVQKEI